MLPGGSDERVAVVLTGTSTGLIPEVVRWRTMDRRTDVKADTARHALPCGIGRLQVGS
jgi:hypothetical protein